MIIKGYLFSLLYGAVCLLLGFLFSKIPGCSKKITRKIVHILIGFEWVILYHFFGGGVHFLIVCLLFLALLLVSYRKNLLPMISSEGDNAPGTVYYCVAMSIMSVITLILPDMIIPFGIGVFCTSLGDGFAGLIGQLMSFPKNVRIYGNKTVFGTLVNFVVCVLTVGSFNSIFDIGFHLWQIVIIALLATELELFTGRGLDNITVTLGTAFLSYFLINFNGAENYIIPILLTPLMIAFAYKKRALDVGGIIAAIVVDVAISISLGNLGFVALLTFFLGGIATDKIKKMRKKSRQNTKKRLERRNFIQVLANSLVATISALLFLLTREKIFVLTFAASLSEALADTTASGIGVLSGRAFDPFRMRSLAPGLSGGMSLLGTAASLIGALVIPTVFALFGAVDFIDFIVITLAAFFGAVFDSLLGSLLQVKYRCKRCGAIVETKDHCNARTVKHSGIAFVDNNLVNFASTVFAAILTAVVFIILT